MSYVPEPEDPRDISEPRVDPREANRRYGKKIRNTLGQIGFLLAGVSLVAAILDGRVLWLITGIAGFCFSLVGLARTYRGQATNKREVQLGVILGIAAIAVGIYWGNKSSMCTFVDVNQQVACVKSHVGLL